MLKFVEHRIGDRRIVRLIQKWLKAGVMEQGRWEPVLVGQFEFREWTPDDHLRHSRFVALREDKKARDFRRELNNRAEPSD
jgi:ATP-dependent DNA ligase